ncbi:type II toxin-antitoxin system RelE/ParE family toxin [Odoribacter lunatus]|uniref:type II toxin-antitoxin system RelE/ParE family toxin n=1 Tax=Odoribacter lunatus TaxID=2941335 RepID=UPI00203BDE8D|nr:type II toxin-antitoxin system RelE/ParE family toxin [Odoribacter lunatus]
MVIVWSDLARFQLISIIEYIENLYGKTTAQHVYIKIVEHVNLLEIFPRMGVRDFRIAIDEFEIRYLINTPNIIHYLIQENKIHIISILDSRQAPEVACRVISNFLQQHK